MSKQAEVSTKWYRADDLPPPFGILVRISWTGYEVTAKRMKDNVWRNARGEKLPIGDEPVIYQPLKPESWVAALPEPFERAAPRMYTSRTAFSAVEAAEAAELASEMEADRRDASRTADETSTTQAKRGARRLQWWRDASLITYSEPGAISKREAEGRVMRAIASDGFHQRADGLGLHESAALVDLSDDQRAALDGLAQPASVIDHFQPLGQDHDDYLTAMSWYAAAPNMVLRLMASDLAFSWREIGERLAVSRQAAQQRHKRAIDAVWTVANEYRHAGAALRYERIERVRRENREFHRRGE